MNLNDNLENYLILLLSLIIINSINQCANSDTLESINQELKDIKHEVVMLKYSK